MTEIKYNTEELEAMTEIHHTDEEDNTEIQYPTEEEMEVMTEIQYPTEEEMEAMYEEFLKSESLHEFFDDDPF